MRFSAAILVCLLTTLPASSEPMDFAIYRGTGEGRTFISQGKLDYTVQDIDVMPWGKKDGQPVWLKSLKLSDGFSIGVMVIRGDVCRGFGLWIENAQHRRGFSWHWFVPKDGDMFETRPGEGLIRVTQSQYSDGNEVQSVEFLSDITLRFQEHINMGPGKPTHEVVVTKGSVLRIAP